MMDYDVIVRIPISARTEREAYEAADEIEETIGKFYVDVAADHVECTGPSEEQ